MHHQLHSLNFNNTEIPPTPIEKKKRRNSPNGIFEFRAPSIMSPEPAKPNVIRRIVNLKQFLKRWRNNSASDRIPPDVPTGHVALYVGPQFKRFVVRTTYLNHPIFMKYLSQAEEEFRFANQGPIVIPCEELEFEEALLSVSRSQSSSPRSPNLRLFRKRCHGGGSDFFSDSRPLVK